MRARHRRNQIVQEAARLGVLVPGVPGYVPMRDRQFMNLRWTKSDGSEDPDWWEVKGNKRGMLEKQEDTQPVSSSDLLYFTEEDDFVGSPRFQVWRSKLMAG